MIIDTHAHLMFKDFEADLEETVLRAKEMGVDKIVNISCDESSADKGIELAKSFKNLYATVGMHPYDADKLTDDLLQKWERQYENNLKVVGIGECGLDYFKAQVEKNIQKKAFEKQVQLAMKLNAPLIIHNRNADQDVLEILDDLKPKKVVFHCYGSDLGFAKKLWSRGYLTSFTGIVTFPNAGSLVEVVREVPQNLFMIETDCPYLAPQAFRGKRNEPSYVLEVLKKVSEIKKIKESDLEKILEKNTFNFFERLNV